MGGVETRWLGGSFFMVYRNNAGRLCSGFISVCLETRWLCHLGGFYVPERPCSKPKRRPTETLDRAITINLRQTFQAHTQMDDSCHILMIYMTSEHAMSLINESW